MFGRALSLSVVALALAGCCGMSCESPCRPGPRIGPYCPRLCCEPPLEQPCRPCPTPPPPCNADLPSGGPTIVTSP